MGYNGQMRKASWSALVGVTCAAGVAAAAAAGCAAEPAPGAAGAPLAIDRDLDADGRADVVVGRWRDDGAGGDAGAADVFLRGAGGSTLAATLRGRAAGDAFGFAAALAGDVNADGYGDVIVGAYRHFAGDVDAGEAYLYLGGPGPSFDTEPDGVITGIPCQEMGYAVAGAGDVDGDGVGDIAIGGRGHGAGAVGRGRVFVVLGAPGGARALAPAVVLSSGTIGDWFGAEIDAPGDVDGDGRDDLVVCAPLVPAWGAGALDGTASASDGGLAYLFLGGEGGPDQEADDVVSGAVAAGRWGACLQFLQ
jgi:hypothetical protein